MKKEEIPYEQRKWYVHRDTGQRGYMVMEDGVEYIKLDRGQYSSSEPYHANRWTEESEPERQCSGAQLARVLHAADVELCRVIGDYDAGSREWLSLSQEARKEWWEKPPKGRRIRARVWAYLKKGMEPLLHG